jgi:TonB family protein
VEVRTNKLEALPHPDATLFVPDPGQSPLSGRIKVPAVLLVVDKRGELEPSPGQQGKATVTFVVGKDGRVIEAQAVSGPADIQKTALRAMRQYRFRPFLILDQPIEVEGTMEFSIN